ncbi:YbaB/EbfC family nucleoid-associated protein [Actinophytocola sp.]|uniref:YbaB/EbfC family nucleoid-associated protein n=1 Tax=Actinophytocola sp. TaxID=1872138 RepID=UPI002ED268CF
MDARIEELERVRHDVDAKLAEVEELTAELARRRFESVAGNVRAVVDGQGGLVDLWIDDDAVGPRVAHPGQLGGDIVTAVAGARQAAAEENARRFHTLLPGMYPQPAAAAPAQDEDDWDPFYQGED